MVVRVGRVVGVVLRCDEARLGGGLGWVGVAQVEFEIRDIE